MQVSLANSDRGTSQLTGLIDTGADAVLASNLLTVELGIDLAENEGESQHAVGGRTLTARYKTISLRLHPADGAQEQYLEWRAKIGFVEDWHSDGLVLLGCVGFLDRFTVTARRFAEAVAIESRDTFDQRFGVVEVSEGELPRLRKDRPPVVEEVSEDAVDLAGEDTRKLLSRL